MPALVMPINIAMIVISDDTNQREEKKMDIRLELLAKLGIEDTSPIVEYRNGEPAVDIYWDTNGVEYRFALPWMRNIEGDHLTP